MTIPNPHRGALVVALLMAGLLIFELLISGCVGTGVKAEVKTDAEQVGGINLQSVLPVGMVVTLAIIALKDALLLLCVLLFSHKREMVRLKAKGA